MSKPKFGGKVLDFHRRKGFGECISNHFVGPGRAVDKLNLAFRDDVVNEVVANIDMFGMGMVLVVTKKSGGSLTREDVAKDLLEQ